MSRYRSQTKVDGPFLINWNIPGILLMALILMGPKMWLITRKPFSWFLRISSMVPRVEYQAGDRRYWLRYLVSFLMLLVTNSRRLFPFLSSLLTGYTLASFLSASIRIHSFFSEKFPLYLEHMVLFHYF